jgi:hypothetical protein
MNTIQINEVLLKDLYTRKIFIGALPIDKLPMEIDYPTCLIINNQKSTKAGEHRLALFFDKNQNAIFFDSFGFSPRLYNLDKYIKLHSRKFDWNKKQLQSTTSTYCGYYCILFLLFICRKKSLNYFLKNFKSPSLNDAVIEKLLYFYI